MRRFALPGLVLPGTVLLALVIAFAIAWGTQPGASRVAAPGGQAAAVTSIARSCPPSAPGAGPGSISMIALPGHTATSPATSTAATSTGAAPSGAATFAAVRAAPAAGGQASPGGN